MTQYYHILHQSPGLVHKFYQDISKVGRPEEDGSMSITSTMQVIFSLSSPFSLLIWELVMYKTSWCWILKCFNEYVI